MIHACLLMCTSLSPQRLEEKARPFRAGPTGALGKQASFMSSRALGFKQLELLTAAPPLQPQSDFSLKSKLN